MRKLFILVMSLCCIGLQAQEDNVQYQLMEGYAKNNIRNRIVVPDIPGYKTLKCDLHMHTIYSDGQVSPTQRVLEAWHEGLDAISITDHQPMPRYFMEKSVRVKKKFARHRKTLHILHLSLSNIDTNADFSKLLCKL